MDLEFDEDAAIEELRKGWKKDDILKEIEELKLHPLFIKNEDEIKETETLGALRAVQFDGDDETVALNLYKAGNLIVVERLDAPEVKERWTHHRYLCLQALKKYDEALLKTKDKDLIIRTLSNMALVFLKMKSWGPAIETCDKVLGLSPGHEKALYRKAQAYFELARYEEAAEVCQKGIEQFGPKSSFPELASRVREEQEKIAKKSQTKVSVLQSKRDKVHAFFTKRGWRISNFESYDSRPFEPELEIDGEDLSLPVLFLFPEHAQVDFAKEVNQHTVIWSLFEQILEQDGGFAWDSAGNYRPPDIELCAIVEQTPPINPPKPGSAAYEKPKLRRKIIIGQDTTFAQILDVEDYVMPKVFEVFVTSKRTPFYSYFEKALND